MDKREVVTEKARPPSPVNNKKRKRIVHRKDDEFYFGGRQNESIGDQLVKAMNNRKPMKPMEEE